jgi:hypothetical protein
VHRKLENVRTREQIAALLDSAPEPSASTIRTFESVIRFAPFLLNRLVRKVAKKAVKGLPENPSGPKPVVEQSQKRAICQYIGSLYGDGVSKKDAQKRAAMKWGVSVRSVERAWAQRGRYDEHEMSIDEAEDAARQWWQGTEEFS